MARDTPVLGVRGVTKRFGGLQALSEVDFDVHAGEVVGLVGDNGAGKSALVKILSGVYASSAGKAERSISSIASSTNHARWSCSSQCAIDGGSSVERHAVW